MARAPEEHPDLHDISLTNVSRQLANAAARAERAANFGYFNLTEIAETAVEIEVFSRIGERGAKLQLECFDRMLKLAENAKLFRHLEDAKLESLQDALRQEKLNGSPERSDGEES